MAQTQIKFDFGSGLENIWSLITSLFQSIFDMILAIVHQLIVILMTPVFTFTTSGGTLIIVEVYKFGIALFAFALIVAYMADSRKTFTKLKNVSI